MSNEERANPFRSQNRANFPPLDEFFDSGISSPADDNSFANFSPEQSFCSRATTSTACHDFSMDMSIGGRAAMAEHRHHVQKYGIDGAAADRSGGDRSSSLSEEDDWDRLMDDSHSHVSLSSTAILGSRKLDEINSSRISRQTHSPEDSYCDDASSSFFDKSIVRTLMTPERVRTRSQEEMQKAMGVTLVRGRVHDSSDSLADDSVGCSTTNGSTCSGMERMFHAALRFNDDFDVQSSFMREDESFSAGRSGGKDKSSSVSFAADTSFATNDSRYGSKRNQRQGRFLENEFNEGLECEDLEFLSSSASPIHKRNKDDSYCGDSSFFGSPSSPSFARVNLELNEASSPPSSSFSTPKASPNRECQTTPLRSGRQVVETDMRATHFSFLGLSPIDSQTGVTTAERHSRSTSLPIQFDESTKKKLFSDEPEYSPLKLSITHESIEILPKKYLNKSSTTSTMKSEESYSSYSSSSPMTSEGATSIHRSRTFGSNSNFRLNSMGKDKSITKTVHKPKLSNGNICNNTSGDPENPQFFEENRRGVRLSRASKLKELGLERVCSMPDYRRSTNF